MSILMVLSLLVANVFVPETVQEFNMTVGKEVMTVQVSENKVWKITSPGPGDAERFSLQFDGLQLKASHGEKSHTIDAGKLLKIASIEELKTKKTIMAYDELFTITPEKKRIIIKGKGFPNVNITWK